MKMLLDTYTGKIIPFDERDMQSPAKRYITVDPDREFDKEVIRVFEERDDLHNRNQG